MTVSKSDLSSFRAIHDPNVTVPAKINAAFEQLRKTEGKEAWRYEGDFMKLARVSQTDLGRFRAQYAANIVETKGRNAKRAWFVDKTVAVQAQETQT